MKVDPGRLKADFLKRRRAVAEAARLSRLQPSLLQYDYLLLRYLSDNMSDLLHLIPNKLRSGLALDVGSGRAPYAALLVERGLEVRSLDSDGTLRPHYVADIEESGLPDNSFDVVLCTEVLEHCRRPWRAVQEVARILKPGGFAAFSAPHVWFYHPHPRDNFRFTAEGLSSLCEESHLEVVQILSAGGSAACFCQIVNFLMFGVTGRLGAPLFLCVNLLGRLLDLIATNQLFCLNFCCLTRKPVGE